MRQKQLKKRGEIICRQLWVSQGEIADYLQTELDFPGVQQVGLLRKTIKTIKTGETRVEQWYVLTSASPERLPAQALLKAVRGHWGIENKLHHVKDRTQKEDVHYSKSPQTGGIFARLRNMAVNLWNRDRSNKDSKPIQALKLSLNLPTALTFLNV